MKIIVESGFGFSGCTYEDELEVYDTDVVYLTPDELENLLYDQARDLASQYLEYNLYHEDIGDRGYADTKRPVANDDDFRRIINEARAREGLEPIQ